MKKSVLFAIIAAAALSACSSMGSKDNEAAATQNMQQTAPESTSMETSAAE